MINTKEAAKIFNKLQAPYKIKVKQGDVVHDIINFDSNCKTFEELIFFFEIQEMPLGDKDIEIMQLKKTNKCLIEELERGKIVVQTCNTCKHLSIRMDAHPCNACDDMSKWEGR